MKLLLLNPTITGEPEAFHLGLTTIGTYVQERSPHRATILDFAFFRRAWKERLRERLDAFEPDLVGMYVSTPFFPSAKRVADELKRLRPGLPILAGGHHATLSPEEVIAHPSIDFLIVGEGERPTLALLDVLERRAAGDPAASLDDVPGLWRKDAGGAVKRVDKGPLLPPEDIPILDWSLYDEETLRTALYFFGMLPVMGSRGCPYRCSFCAITNVQRLYKGEGFLRFRDPIAVVDEIERNHARYGHLGVRMVYFYDLNFLVRQDWLRAFTDEYKRRGLNRKLPWSAYTRADHVNRMALESLKDSGCVQLRVGIEAAHPTMRNDVYVKQLSQERLVEATRAIKAAGIANVGYFLVGGPGERPEYLLDSLEFSYDEGVEFPTFFLFKPLAGTDVLEHAAEMGSVIDARSMESAADFMHGVNMTHTHVSERQLVAFQKLTQAMFGSRVVWNQARRDPAGWARRLTEYFVRATRHGFTPYEALVYFAFYGYDHLTAPPHFEAPAGRSLRARLLFRGLRAVWRSKDGGPPPPTEEALRGSGKSVATPRGAMSAEEAEAAAAPMAGQERLAGRAGERVARGA